ncbi:hypothetical protein QZH41_011501, partial [Actinostola sp. cb2023]
MKKMEKLMTEVNTRPSPQTWTALGQLTQVRLITFNKRRSGEASRLLLKDFVERPSWKKSGCDAIKQTLNPIEKHICK